MIAIDLARQLREEELRQISMSRVSIRIISSSTCHSFTMTAISLALIFHARY